MHKFFSAFAHFLNLTYLISQFVLATKADAFIIHLYPEPPSSHSKPPLLNRLPFNLIYAG